MKKALQFLAAVAALASGVAGLDLAGVVHLIPSPWDAWVAVAPAGAATVFHFLIGIGDLLDDGQKNDSFKVRLLPWLLLAPVALCFSSCAGVISGATGQPIPSTPVQREGGPPVNVATADLFGAEAAPPTTVWGLYDAGWVARKVGQVSGSK